MVHSQFTSLITKISTSLLHTALFICLFYETQIFWLQEMVLKFVSMQLCELFYPALRLQDGYLVI